MSEGYTLHDLQQTQLALVKRFDALCTKHDLRYSMAGGTMLGAVRHAGFIPWDDDIDVVMPRPDYERFLEIAQSELPARYGCRNYRTEEAYNRAYSRLYDRRVQLKIGGNTQDVTMYAWIDIFPLDGMPKGRLWREVHYFKMLVCRFLYHASFFQVSLTRKRPLYMRLLIRFLQVTGFGRGIDTKKMLRRIEKMLVQYPYDASDTIVCFFGMYMRREIIPKSFYGTMPRYDFEDTQLRGAEQPDAFLRNFFGDYRQLPPESERGSHSITEVTLCKEWENTPS